MEQTILIQIMIYIAGICGAILLCTATATLLYIIYSAIKEDKYTLELFRFSTMTESQRKDYINYRLELEKIQNESRYKVNPINTWKEEITEYK